MTWFDDHRARLERAVQASRTREAYTPFQESPSRKHHPEGAHEAGRAAFEARLGKPYDTLSAPGQTGWLGAEVSPYTGEPLGVTYPACEVGAMMDGVLEAWPAWKAATPETRVGVCMELLARWEADTFQNAYATMHTAGQAFMLAFAGSGASSLDRGLEGVASAWDAMSQIPATATYARPFGRGPDVVLEKRYRLVPVGVAVVLSCASYPAWNAYPAILANLATGNPVVLKPHPDTILPMARAVELGQQVLREAGFDPNLFVLATDTREAPVAVELFDHPATAIIDFTGGQDFGRRIERDWAHLQVYTETAGCNAVVLESADDLDAVLGALAHGICLFSSQMCTAPQNLWMPATGVREGDTTHAPDEVLARLIDKIDAIAAHPQMAAGVLGALQTPRIADAMDRLSKRVDVVRPHTPYEHHEHPGARTTTPLIARIDPGDRAVAQREHFGPVVFAMIAKDRDEALRLATHDAKTHGAIASYAYTSDPGWWPEVEDAFAAAGASVGINLVRQRPMNFTAAFSDFHVTGLNPAGTACLTDPAFVTRRFRVVQSKREIQGDPS